MHAEKNILASLGADTPLDLDALRRFHGLSRVPFTPDERDPGLFGAAGQSQAVELLDTTAALRGVMTLTGAPGTGKTSLIKHWITRLEPKRYLPVLITQSSLSATGVLEMLLARLGIRPRFKRSANLLLLENHLQEIEPLTLVLILDDAQNYPGPALEDIRMLLGAGGKARPAFALILLGDEYLMGSLRLSIQRALFSRVSAACQMAALQREEIAHYLRWHINHAGLQADLFTPAAIDLLAEAAEGNPRLLDQLARAAWIAAASQRSTQVESDHVNAAFKQVPAASAKIHPV